MVDFVAFAMATREVERKSSKPTFTQEGGSGAAGSTQPVVPTNGMVVTTLPVVSAKLVVPTLPVVQIHVPLLPGPADIAAVLAYRRTFEEDGSSEHTGALLRIALLRCTCCRPNGTPCCDSGT